MYYVLQRDAMFFFDSTAFINAEIFNNLLTRNVGLGKHNRRVIVLGPWG